MYISELNMSTLLFKNQFHSLNSKLLITLYYIVQKVIFFTLVLYTKHNFNVASFTSSYTAFGISIRAYFTLLSIRCSTKQLMNSDIPSVLFTILFLGQ